VATFLKRVPRQHLIAGIVFVLLLLYPVVNPWQPYPQGVMLLGFLLAVQAVSWNIISGYAGYISLGHSMFLGLGSYTAAIIALHSGVNPLWVAPLGGVTAVLVAVVFGSVVLRTRGHAFVIITIALLLSAQIVATNWKSLTNGSDGITLELPFWSSDFQNIPFYYIFLLLLVLTVVFSAWISRTKFAPGWWPSARTRARPRRSGSTPPSSRSWRSGPARSSSAWPAACTRTTRPSSTRSVRSPSWAAS